MARDRRGAGGGVPRGLTVAALVVATGFVAVSGLVAPGCAASGGGAVSGDATPAGANGDAILAAAFRDHAGDLEVQGGGSVARLLADDDEGSRHQRFIVRLDSGQTLLLAHNIDVAPRVEGLDVGDRVAFRGVYEWSTEGGTIHWTHHDPGGGHAPGWLRHEGTTYE